MFLLNGLWRGIKGLAKLCFPFFAKARDLRHPGRRLRLALRLLILAAVLVLLGYINYWADLERVLRAPVPLLRRIWLPLLFLLIYAMTWLSWWLWELLTAEAEGSEFPDIDEAWAAAIHALDQASIDITQAPLFLILGSPLGTEEALLNAARLSLEVGRTPRTADAPLHVYANRDGIYLTCPGASLLGKQAALLAEPPPAAAAAPAQSPPGSPAPSRTAPAPALAAREASLVPFEPGVLGRGLEPNAPRAVTAAGSDLQELPNPPRRQRASLFRDKPEVERITARLQHLCRLIVRSRRPYCPINGILILIPFAATESDDIGAVCHHDRSVVREILQVHCPAFAVVCDLEEVPGFRTFIGRFPEEQREKVLGLDLPLVPVVDEPAFARMINEAVRWINQVLVPTLVYRLWRLEGADRKDAAEVLQQNIELYHVMMRLQERQDRVFRALAGTFASESPGSTLFGGCYLAATGRDAAREQAFVAGVFRRLLESQNFVTWTAEALAEDADYRRWARLGWGAIVVFLVLVVALGYYYWVA